MKIPIFQVDAFAAAVFEGNPAAVCPLQEWPEDAVLQAVASENNLSETAFLAPEREGYRIRWFTPVKEVDLCGHATLAAAHVIFRYFEQSTAEIVFASKGGPLVVRREGELLALDFPARTPSPVPPPGELLAGLQREPLETLGADDYLVVFPEMADVVELVPDFEAFRRLDLRGVVVTARGVDVDFVSRFFAPRLGIDEDPVTGSSHCELVPYWSKVLGKRDLHARQLSKRGGELFCEDRGERIIIAGRAVLYLEGTITI